MKKLSSILFSLLILINLLAQTVLADKASTQERNKHSNSLLQTTSTGIYGLEKASKRPNGTLVVNNRLSGNGTVQARHVIIESELSPGNSPGCINFKGDITFQPSGALVSEIAGLIPCTEHDQINVSGTLNLNDTTLQVVLLNGYIPGAGDTFTIMTWGAGITGTFATIDTSAAVLPEPLTWDTSLLYLTGELIVSAPQVADGDLAPWDNPDGVINAADILVAEQLALGLRAPGTLQYTHGDMNTDGVINIADLILIQQVVF